MKKIGITVLLIISFVAFTSAQETREKVRIYGKITYFDGKPVVGGEVSIRDSRFNSVVQTKTDDQGNYELLVEKGKYMAFFACKDYMVHNLEFWAWNFLAYEDMELNARIDGVEVYAVNAFRIQGSPMPSITIFCRPFSLKKFQASGLTRAEVEKLQFIDFAPKLTAKDIEVSVNGNPAKVLEITPMREATGENKFMPAYMIQAELPCWTDVMQIWVTLTDSETGERGEACFFLEKPF